MTHPALLDPAQLASDCEIAFTRRSGPGGQNRNKVETAVILRHRPSGLKAEANERRSQAENRRLALFRLRLNLALAVRSPDSDDPLPELWTRRTRNGRIHINADHDDFPAMLAIALDTLAHFDWKPPESSEPLGCTPTQLLKLLRAEPRAWLLLNAERERHGLTQLH